MYTDSTDCMVHKPKHGDAKAYYTFKRRKFAMRYAITVACDTGDICWVSDGYPAGSIGDININRRAGIVDRLQSWERIGADGAYLSKANPEYRCPHRKPRGGSLTRKQIEENNEFGHKRTIVENVFARLKQFAAMRQWRHAYHLHIATTRFIFQLLQVKQRFRPIRKIDKNSLEYTIRVAKSWQQAEKTCFRPASQPKKKRGRPKRSRSAHEDNGDAHQVVVSSDTDSDDNIDEKGLNLQPNRFSAHCVGEQLDVISRRRRRRQRKNMRAKK
ncbi:hypothetical protein AAMO2058_001704400 [Amorphochlora amoebiformis]|mmetsp:Transcript_34911/g.56329  ORF Transcript_34911/g.56329 Transcript_34911/m.56329 type:complete len:272 (-) Transcript_34911:36-851(-)